VLAGVMGWPVAHSRSPLIHGHWIAHHGLRGAYVPLAVQAGQLEQALRALPVLGFAGAELALVLGLFVLHRRWAGRCIERISLSHDQLRILRIDGRGRAYEAVLEPYWARLRVEEGAAARLMIGQRGQESEIGLYLNEDEKRDLARALTAALGRYREPRFDNPQLR
jgi:uncharacterized membrane protein